MKFNNTRVMNFQGAFRGLRNPLESWAKSDSLFGIGDEYDDADYEIAKMYLPELPNWYTEEWSNEDYEKQEIKAKQIRENGILTDLDAEGRFEYAYIGPADLDLAQRMIKAGAPDRKFLRQIFVCVDITGPLYWFKEFDTYKIGTVANSTSTMHKLASTPITKECFEMDDFQSEFEVLPEQKTKTDYNSALSMGDIADNIITYCEALRLLYKQTKDKKYWKELIRWLPNGWLQTRTVTLNYEILRNIYFQRKGHKLTEWHQFCDWIASLPYAKELILYTTD